jgi:NAD(P)-dependent dehydrogenase (short-subunit alcohol dehydrogenase family)
MSEPARVTLITGASRGIGRAAAERLAAEGHRVVGLARRAPTGGGFPGDLVAVDLADRRATADALGEIASRFEINGLVNNVGLHRPQPLEELDLAAFDAVINVNMAAAIQCAQVCLPAMKRQRFGRIVNISTELVLGLETRTAYSAAKAGLISFARTWALELAPFGVTVNAIAPGPVNTDGFNARNPAGSPARRAKLARIPLGRIGEPADVAHAVAFFMSAEAGFVTGQTLFVCGGSSLGKLALP